MRLDELIEARLQTLGMDTAALHAALGIRNRHKSEALSQRVAEGDMRKMSHLRRPLSRILDLPLPEIDAAIAASRVWAEAQREAAWRAAFRPHAVLVTEHRRPVTGQIMIAMLTGAPGKLVIPLPEDLPLPRWPRHVVGLLPAGLPGFGRVTGFVLNYTPDEATRFDRDARPIETLPAAYRPLGPGRIKGISPAAIGVTE